MLRAVYRQLLRCGKALDRHPLAKALLIAQPEKMFDRHAREVVQLPALEGGKVGIWASALAAHNGGEFYSPQAEFPSSSACDAIRGTRRQAQPADADPIDTGLEAIRRLGLALTSCEALEAAGFDCGSPSAVDALTSLRPVDAAEPVQPGSLLITHPVACLSQPALHHAVILVVSANEQGVAGVVLNKPIDVENLPGEAVTLGEAVTSEERKALGQLAPVPLYHGGDVQERSLVVLHELPGLQSSGKVAEGLYATSDFGELCEALNAGRAAAEAEAAKDPLEPGPPEPEPRVKVVAGHAGWNAQQLAQELERHVWFHARADEASAGVAGLALLGRADGPADTRNDADWLRDAMWAGAVRQLGGEHAELARCPGDHALVWEHMQALWERQTDELHQRIDRMRDPSGDAPALK